MGGDERQWYCSWCGFGPHSYTLNDGCIECGRRRDWDEQPSSTQSFHPPLSPPSHSHSPAITYAMPRTESPQTVLQAESEPNLDFQSFASSSFTRDVGESIKGMIDYNAPSPGLLGNATKAHTSLLLAGGASDNSSLISSQTEYGSPEGHPTEENVNAHVPDTIKQRAGYLTYLILGGVEFKIKVRQGVITCTGQGRRPNPRSDQSNEPSQNPSSSSGGSASGSGLKRRHGKELSEADKRGGRDDNEKRLGVKRLKRTEELDTKPFACPFYKRNRRKCNRHRACAGPGWMESHRLKEHLFRDHLIFQCRRCWETFATTEDLDEHQQELLPCTARLVRHVFAINQRKREQLQVRKKFGTREQRWRWMFSVIFPHVPDDQIPSPYYESEEEDDDDSDSDSDHPDSDRVFGYLQSVLPGQIGEHLEQRIEESIASAHDGGERYREIRNSIDRRDFRDLLSDSILQALNHLQREFAPGSISQSEGVVAGAEEAVGIGDQATICPEIIFNPQSAASDTSFPWPNWTLDIDLSNYDAVSALYDLGQLESRTEGTLPEYTFNNTFMHSGAPQDIPSTATNPPPSSSYLQSTSLGINPTSQHNTMGANRPRRNPMTESTVPTIEQWRNENEDDKRFTLAAQWDFASDMMEELGYEPFPAGFTENLFGPEYSNAPDTSPEDEGG